MHEDPSDAAVPPEGAPRISIRPVRAGDASELRRLYDTLDTDDRHRRFFSSYHPGPRFFADLTTVEQRRDARFVAVLHAPPSEDRVVGEAGYGVLPDGNGELAMTIERGGPGWLGPYLLDAVAEAAARSGVPNLEADVLTVDEPMLGLLRSRGSVVMEHDGWSVVRVLIGTGGRRPTWSASRDQLRVLVEGAGGRWHAEHEARTAGLQVLTCSGPIDEAHDCPAMAGQPCPLAAGADVIVVSRPPDDGWLDLMRAHAELHPGVPVCIERPDGGAGDHASTTCPIVARAGVLSFVADLRGVIDRECRDFDDQ
jgi:hypothetical protein